MAWHWVVDVDAALPAVAETLATCHGFLVDDDCGRAVGVVEDVGPDQQATNPLHLIVVRGWGRSRTVLVAENVVEIAPGARRLVVACGGPHRLPGRHLPWWRPVLTRATARLARLTRAAGRTEERADP